MLNRLSTQLLVLAALAVAAVISAPQPASSAGTVPLAGHNCASNVCSGMPTFPSGDCVFGDHECDFQNSTADEIYYCYVVEYTCHVFNPLEPQTCNGQCVENPNISCRLAFNKCQMPPCP